jgi:hypothetical protein
MLIAVIAAVSKEHKYFNLATFWLFLYFGSDRHPGARQAFLCKELPPLLASAICSVVQGLKHIPVFSNT